MCGLRKHSIVSIWLLKDNLFAYVNNEFMAKNGTLLLFNAPVVKATTWEGLRQ